MDRHDSYLLLDGMILEQLVRPILVSEYDYTKY